ncbi:MAG TPA: hypothetical protein VJ110_01605 [Candidatus Nanoarchaeia archaeon]|nr:hypothetical protein [Candidatus Nanoarchaeia archaeon]
MKNLTETKVADQLETPKPETDFESLLEKSVKAAADIRHANAETAALLDRQERLMAAQMLSGRSEAGQITPAIKPEDEFRMKERAYWKGTMVEKALQQRDKRV